MYETLKQDVVAPEAHRNDDSYVRKLGGPTLDLLHKNLVWQAVTRRTSKKNTEPSKLGVGACTGWALSFFFIASLSGRVPLSCGLVMTFE